MDKLSIAYKTRCTEINTHLFVLRVTGKLTECILAVESNLPPSLRAMEAISHLSFSFSGDAFVVE